MDASQPNLEGKLEFHDMVGNPLTAIKLLVHANSKPLGPDELFPEFSPADLNSLYSQVTRLNNSLATILSSSQYTDRITPGSVLRFQDYISANNWTDPLTVEVAIGYYHFLNNTPFVNCDYLNNDPVEYMKELKSQKQR